LKKVSVGQLCRLGRGGSSRAQVLWSRFRTLPTGCMTGETRYRHLMLKVDLSNRRLVDEHQQLVSAVIERDAIKGAELLRAHMALTANIS
jgi:DNA-binding GntR family transcriptional regulator